MNEIFKYFDGEKTVILRPVFDNNDPSCENCYLYNETRCSDFCNQSFVDGYNCANHPEQTFHFEEVTE